ncbi:pilus assembly protein PilZ [Geomonas sp.]|uniref:pilus assembly protein PilZ n=1 Tax=Geomonas sp. TaxID=2651584 RepID=UPI002B463039|nr:pilus assembly protein PilZ [Geomonas sp.]
MVADSAERLESGKPVNKAHLVNRLNYINFQDQFILVALRHLLYDNELLLHARPLPCAGERLECLWTERESLQALLKSYRFDHLLIPDGKKYLVVVSEAVQLDEQGLSLVLPPACREFEARRIRRHETSGVTAQMMQHAALLEGELLDFTPISVRLAGSVAPPASFPWFNPDGAFNLRLGKGGSTFCSGPFEMVSHREDGLITVVLRPVDNSIQRFKSKRFRNARQRLVPSPNVLFDHPLIGKRVNLKVLDISGTGFAVEEREGDCVLMVGMVIPQLKINFAHGFSMTCTAQVVSRNPGEEGREQTVRCGAVILDMDIRDHVRLLSMLHQAGNQRSYVCTEVDMNDLWDFFFETGFIYPGKYAHFQANKEEIKRTYARLYGDNPDIARHFIYLDRGAILGHLAMVRFYSSSWMIHHHAARKSVTIKAGLAVLEQVGQYLNELENFTFAHLRHVYCYYRPDNKFPSRVFGGFARSNQDARVCSQDSFGYFHFQGSGAKELPAGWECTASSDFDLAELASFYRFRSGGLLLEAFDLDPQMAGRDDLEREYRALGFTKEKFHYSLKKEGSLKAFLLVNRTDAGFNMSDLTSCVTLMVLDEDLPRELVDLCMEEASRHYEGNEMPVLGYPLSWLDRHLVPYEKTYLLWILNLQYTDNYFEYCQGLFKMARKSDHSVAES